jgi:hypothetical protein
MRTSGVRVPPAGPGARRMLATGRAGATDVPCDGNPHHIRRRAPDARGSTGESACLRSRRVQVRVLPGVLCPKRKWAMRRDVAPEEAGSSPAGHPEYDDQSRTTRASCTPSTAESVVPDPYDGRPHDRSPYTREHRTRGSGPTGRGAWLRTRRFRVRIPGAAPDTEITDLAARGRAHWRGGGTR